MAWEVAKQQFLAIGNVTSINQAARHSLQAALQTRRGKAVYAVGIPEDKRAPFRTSFAALLHFHSEQCRQNSDENTHISAIESIAAEVSRQSGNILCDGCLRIGIAQKAFNLYLKYAWCLDPAWPVPPHCPIDGIILGSIGVPGAWTSMNCLATYMQWIAAIRTHAKGAGYSSLAEWELETWAKARQIGPAHRCT